jgi:hypothetical protein
MKRAFSATLVALFFSFGCATNTDDPTAESGEAFSIQTTRVTCESEGYRYRSCGVDTYGGTIVDMRVANQLSHPPGDCTEGTSFGFGPDYVWVDHGCRADFEVRLRSNGGGGWGSIHVLSATYGGNAGASYGNATNNVSYHCNGSGRCDYLISVNELGDPAYGRRKDFNVDWSCGDDGQTQHAHIDAEANGLHVYLTCN